jgi:hypothetical protein
MLLATGTVVLFSPVLTGQVSLSAPPSVSLTVPDTVSLPNRLVLVSQGAYVAASNLRKHGNVCK